jgi:hypothetical protein
VDADSTKAATEYAQHFWGEIGAFLGGVLGLRGMQWWFSGRSSTDLASEIRQLRESMDRHNATLTELLQQAVLDLAVLKDRK